ncbi:MAG: CHRD domain-containing protein, partial [Rhizobiales bacterium]|nr:CHRD domain-containing protein [Hyphomicrobiales bacterium]
MSSYCSQLAGLVFAAGLAFGGAASAEMMEMNIDLSGAEEVPPVETSATGEVEVEFDSDTRMLSWEIDYSGLSSDATAAH